MRLESSDRINQKCSVLSCFFYNFPHLCLMFSCYLLLPSPPPALRGISSAPDTAYFRVRGVFLVILVYLVGSPVNSQPLVLVLSSATFSYLDASYVQLVFSPLVVTLFPYLCKMLKDCVWLCPHSVRKYLHTVAGYIISVCF